MRETFPEVPVGDLQRVGRTVHLQVIPDRAHTVVYTTHGSQTNTSQIPKDTGFVVLETGAVDWLQYRNPPHILQSIARTAPEYTQLIRQCERHRISVCFMEPHTNLTRALVTTEAIPHALEGGLSVYLALEARQKHKESQTTRRYWLKQMGRLAGGTYFGSSSMAWLLRSSSQFSDSLQGPSAAFYKGNQCIHPEMNLGDRMRQWVVCAKIKWLMEHRKKRHSTLLYGNIHAGTEDDLFDSMQDDVDAIRLCPVVARHITLNRQTFDQIAEMDFDGTRWRLKAQHSVPELRGVV